MSSPHLSFEFFPPKTTAGINALLQTAGMLTAINPSYFSVTFGAAGSAQTHTPDTVFKIKKHTRIQTAPHISCVAAEKENIKNLLDRYIQKDISRLVVLRGDAPANTTIPSTHFQHASELVQFIREQTGNHFHIDVACYPEFHPQTTDVKRALFHLKEKMDAGANSMITQYFYNPDAYFRFRDDCEKFHITAPITPGIMPIIHYEKLVSFSNACGAEIPRWLKFRLENYKNDIISLHTFCDDVLTDLCEKLLSGGASGLHFYTLNKSEYCLNILKNLKINPVFA
ncbi:MAG: hypothetical protein ACD_42C00109G0005 [uncultured bacterium]|nr:MAG: hypothetical protein ACD_42C00109G0005 [uncultured bacterium]OGT34285.1 MAG: methylenetetrahydrofolate reductase [NAD(P)H] [Gammaproteobacteria bacterium RIFCSPHIGHO2_02_FULL_39_13]OGT48934.1 MAG: methylenetetrahydrofolate reductase [NAD(P)H] [Gammaproteobacteria bacterium RIFCSPHIGHO2_12_FULL_39_24]